MTDEKAGLPILAFASPAEWEAWLEAQPRASPGCWVQLARKDSGIASVSRAQAVEGALCHGWIDGQADSRDAASWLVRFTPRRPRGKWSLVNRRAALALIEAARMRPAGLAEIERARADGRWDAAYAPPSEAKAPLDLTAALDASPAARDAFTALDSHNRFAMIYRVEDARKPETRAKRIATFVAMLERGERLHPRKRSRS